MYPISRSARLAAPPRYVKRRGKQYRAAKNTVETHERPRIKDVYIDYVLDF